MGNIKHGFYGTRFYRIWADMKRRGLSTKGYKTYKEHGISVCDRWLKFENFRDDMYAEYMKHSMVHGEKDTTIERVDNLGDYKPSNCKWATWAEQRLNKSNNRYLEYNGDTLCLSDWARRFNIGEATLRLRISLGWPTEKALTTPVRLLSKRIYV